MTIGIAVVACFAASRRGRGDDQVHLEADKFSRERGKLFGFPLGEPSFNSNVLALNPTEIA